MNNFWNKTKDFFNRKVFGFSYLAIALTLVVVVFGVYKLFGKKRNF